MKEYACNFGSNDRKFVLDLFCMLIKIFTESIFELGDWIKSLRENNLKFVLLKYFRREKII